MGRSPMNPWRRVAGRWAAGTAVLAAGAWLAWEGVWWLMPLEEPLGQVWYAVYRYAGHATAVALSAIAGLAMLHVWRHGRDDLRPRGPDDVVCWWALLERGVHWGMVLGFAVLLITGVELYYAGFGLPSPLTRTMRAWHTGVPFMVLGGLLFVHWMHDALPRRYDLTWLRRLGGHLGRRNDSDAPPPAGRFNAGQKLWFWAEAAAGLVMGLTGQMMLRFSRMDDGYLTLLALHLAAAVGFVTVLAVHFYLAVVGVRGALGGMIHGRVGRAAALRLHSEAEALRRP